MLVLTSSDEEHHPRRLSITRNRDNELVLRLYEPIGHDFESDLEGRLIGGIRLDSLDLEALEKML